MFFQKLKIFVFDRVSVAIHGIFLKVSFFFHLLHFHCFDVKRSIPEYDLTSDNLPVFSNKLKDLLRSILLEDASKLSFPRVLSSSLILSTDLSLRLCTLLLLDNIFGCCCNLECDWVPMTFWTNAKNLSSLYRKSLCQLC